MFPKRNSFLIEYENVVGIGEVRTLVPPIAVNRKEIPSKKAGFFSSAFSFGHLNDILFETLNKI